MLRAIQTPHLRPIVTCGQITTTSGPTIVADIGGGDFSALTRNSAGKATLTRSNPPVRPGIVIGSCGADIADGGHFTYDTDPATASVVMEVLGASGSGDDGTFDFLSIDYRSENTDRSSPLQSVVSSSMGMRWIVARITAAGAISYGHNQIASVSKASSVYTITFKNAFARTPLVFACPVAAAQKSYRVTGKTASTCTIATFDSSEAAEDNAFHLVVVGWDRKDDTWGMERAIHVAQRKPRIECFRIDGTGTAELELGSTDAILVDNGTGDYSLTWTKPFAFAPVVIPIAKANRAQLASAATSTSANIVTFGATGSAADDEVCALVVGFDCTTEQ